MTTDVPGSVVPVSVVGVETRRQMRQFLQLPRRLYRGMPGFVMPLDLERRGLLHPKVSAFFAHGRARYFLAMRGARVVGRISAQVDPMAIAQWKGQIGLFGALDAIDDQAVVTALLSAAEAWLSAEGMTAIRGPYTLSANGESGLLIEGQREPTMLMLPWHPAYLGALVEGAGLPKVKDLLAYRLEIGAEAEAALPVLRARLGADGAGLTMRSMRPKRIAEDAAIMGRLYNDAWQDNWGFVPITDLEMTAMVKELKPMLRPDHLVMAERDGEPVGFALILPNIYDVVGDLGGSPGPAGWVRFVSRLLRHRFVSGRVILLGVAHSLRGTTLGSIMPSLIIAELMRRRRTIPFRAVELGWILEDNMPMRRLIERQTPRPTKLFRLYERSLVPES